MTFSDLSGLNELVNILVCREHRLILLQGLILTSVRTICIDFFALDAILAVLSGFHVSEETQDVGIIAAGFSQLVQLSGQLGRNQVRVGRVTGGIPIHRAHRVLPAAFRVVSKAGENGVQTWQQGRVERVVVRQKQRARWYLMKDLPPIINMRVYSYVYLMITISVTRAARCRAS